MKNSNTETIPNKTLNSQITDFDLTSYNDRKDNSIKLSKRLDTLQPQKSKRNTRIRFCSEHLTRDVYKHIKTNDKKSVVRSFSCRHHFCAQCQYKKSRKLFHEVYESLAYMAHLDQKDYSYYLLTLTTPNPKMSDLRSTIQTMKKAWNRISDPKSTTKKYAPIRKMLKGYFLTLEFITDKTPAGQAHPHFHIILVFNKSYSNSKHYINRAQWLDIWRYAMKDQSITQVDIKKISARHSLKTGKTKTAMVSAISEVVKYSVKPTTVLNLNDEDLLHLLEQTHKIRTYSRSTYFTSLSKHLKTDPEILKLKDEESQLWELIYTEIYGYDKFYKMQSTTKDKNIKPPTTESAQTLDVIIDEQYLL